MKIRPVAASDYAALARTATDAFRTPHFADELREEDTEAQAPGLRFERWVAEVDGQVAGTAGYFQPLSRFHPHKFWMDAYVHPDYQRRGIGSALFSQVLNALQPHEPISIRTFTREDIPHAIAFLEKREFHEAKRIWRSALDLAAFDFARFFGVTEQVLASGIAIQIGVPDIDPAAAVSLEQFQESRLNSPRFLPEGQFIALDGERWVGMSTLWTTPEPEMLYVGLTGVLPEYRRRGLALALKLRGLAFAREWGYGRIGTHNASTNVGMLAINNQLGFVREPAWLHLLREGAETA